MLEQRLENFLITLGNPVRITAEEMIKILRELRRMRDNPSPTTAQTAGRLGISIAWTLGSPRATEAVREAYHAGAITDEEYQGIRLGIASTFLFPPPPDRVLSFAQEARMEAERATRSLTRGELRPKPARRGRP